jgi:hypothetical protein
MPVLDRLPRLAGLALTGARRAGELGLDAARDIAEGVQRRRRSQSSAPSTTPPPPPAASASSQPSAAPAPSDAPLTGEPAPDHVDREAVIVAESHDPGAAGGVGAQIRIDPRLDDLKQ